MMTTPYKRKFAIPTQMATVPMPEWARYEPPDVQRAVALTILEQMIKGHVNLDIPCEGVTIDIIDE